MSPKKEAGQGKRRKLCVCEGKGSEEQLRCFQAHVGPQQLETGLHLIRQQDEGQSPD